jgi:hypothetical protein
VTGRREAFLVARHEGLDPTRRRARCRRPGGGGVERGREIRKSLFRRVPGVVQRLHVFPGMMRHDLSWDDVPSRLMEAGFLCVCRECGAAFRTVGEWLEARCRGASAPAAIAPVSV